MCKHITRKCVRVAVGSAPRDHGSGERLLPNKSSATKMLRDIVKSQIIEKILRPMNYDPQLGHRKFSVLILDKNSMRVLNSCLGLNEVFEEGVTLVEDLTRCREPMPSIEAIYIISPTADSIQRLIEDFTQKSKYALKNSYKAANIFFLDPCDDELFAKLSKSPAVKFIKTLKEFNLSYAPLEQQIFTVSNADVSRTADGIVSLCASLNLYPTLSAELCYRVDQKLKELQKHQNELVIENDAQLIIMDRSFDLISPLLHETTLQSMAADLTDFKNGIYNYTASNGENKVTSLDENDVLWTELRHKHIAEVLQKVSAITKETTKSARSLDESASIRELGDTIRQMPASQKMVSKLAAYINIADECQRKFFDELEKIIILEQDMATGYTPEGEKLKDSQAVARLSTLILPAIPTETRLRLILIFMLTIGKSKDEQFFYRLLHHTDIPEEQYELVRKMLIWRSHTHHSHPRPLCEEERFPSCRWEPKIREVLQEAAERRLDEREFRFMSKKPESTGQRTASSARYGSGLNGRAREKRKIILFIVGGMTFSEMKTVYEMSALTNTTIFLGSDAVLTPSDFLHTIRNFT
ncbi:unnamed protein product [Caenorhabditis sp. 36 PRJEB53466]|nr:unnamed protein product [Caenorhabditis sp. 36 PRJEB53466]